MVPALTALYRHSRAVPQGTLTAGNTERFQAAFDSSSPTLLLLTGRR